MRPRNSYHHRAIYKAKTHMNKRNRVFFAIVMLTKDQPSSSTAASPLLVLRHCTWPKKRCNVKDNLHCTPLFYNIDIINFPNMLSVNKTFS